MGVGNVGYFQKTFFVERGRAKVHIAPEVTKHRTSLGKSTDVLHRKYGCLPQRSPMFSFSETDEKKIKNQHAVCDSRGVFY